jgi:uncharacterized membrane protein YccC
VDRAAPPSLLRSVTRDLARIDRSGLMPVAGAIAALPVVAFFAVGLGFWDVQTAVTLTLGAHLVAIASTVRTTRTPYFMLCVDALVLGLATFIGLVSEPIEWAHIVLLLLVSLAGGLLVSLGPTPSVIGTQAVMAYLIFGRFHESGVGSVELAAFVLVGAAAEALFLSIVRWPPGFRRQRDALSAGLRALAGSADGTSGPSTVAAGTELDRASELLSAQGLFGRDDQRSLRGLVDEARRIRIELAALNGLRRRSGHEAPTTEMSHAIAGALDQITRALAKAAIAVDEGRPDPSMLENGEAIDAALATVAAPGDPDASSLGPISLTIVHHLQAIGGQLRAMERLLGERADPRWHLHGGQSGRWRKAAMSWTEQARQLRANLTLQSPAMRHALRLAVAVPLSDVLAQLAGLPRSYWVPLTVAVVLRPDFGSLFGRGVGRVAGTCIGVGVAGFILAGFHPDHAVIIVLLALTCWGAYAFFQSNFAVASTFVAATILLLLSVTQVNTTTTALDRLLDTLLGGGVALAAYLVWPTWSNGATRRAMSRLVAAQRAYVEGILCGAVGDLPPDGDPLSLRARRARLAWMEAEATVMRSLSEPTKWRVDVDLANSLMAALLRLVQAAHALRLEVAAATLSGDRQPVRDLRDAMDTALTTIAAALDQNQPVGTLPPLRALHESASARLPPTLVVELDEMVNVIDTIGHLLDRRQLERVTSAPDR